MKQIELFVNVPEDLPQVYCDPDKVGRVLVNYIVNGIKRAGGPGQVVVSAENRTGAQEVVVRIDHSGVGSDFEQPEIVVERFREMTARGRCHLPGFGLGLGIARELIDLNLGSTWVENVMGRGQTHRFSLPCANPHEVMRRYLARQSDIGNDDWWVAMLSANAAEGGTDADARDVEALLNLLLRRNDLLFRTGPRRWTLALACPDSELPRFLERAEKLRRELDRNRVSSPLPEVLFTVHGVWDATTAEGMILDVFDQLAANDAHACT